MPHPGAECLAGLLEVGPGVSSVVVASACEAAQLLPECCDDLLPRDDQLTRVPLRQAPCPPESQHRHGGASAHSVGHLCVSVVIHSFFTIFISFSWCNLYFIHWSLVFICKGITFDFV